MKENCWGPWMQMAMATCLQQKSAMPRALCANWIATGTATWGSLEIKPTPPSGASQGFSFTTEFGLTRFNCDDLQEILGTQKIVSQRITKGTASYANYAKDGLGIRRKAEVRIIGTTTGLAKVLNLQMKSGRFLEKRDNDYFDSVATIGPDVASGLFPGENPIGKHLRMTHDTSNFHSIIVGVLKDKNQVKHLLIIVLTFLLLSFQ